MTVTVADSSALIRPNQPDGGPTDLQFRKTDLLDFLRAAGRIGQWKGASPASWALQYSGNASAELFVESQAASLPGKRLFATASMRPWYVRAMASLTGHLLDIVQNGGTYEDLLTGELKDAVKAVLYLIEQTLCGSAQDKGIASLIDSADVAHGVDPASVTLWSALETGSIGTLDTADMQTFEVDMSLRGANPDVILGNVNQLRNYGNIQGPVAGSSSLLRGVLPNDSGKPYDIGVNQNGMSFNGRKLVPVRTLTNTEMYWLSLGDDPEFGLKVMRDIRTEQYGKRNDDSEYAVTMGLALKVGNRRLHGKMTGITA